jgi:hypothetical protein
MIRSGRPKRSPFAERRQRGAVCRTCHGPVRYTTYMEARWQEATQQPGTSALPVPHQQP